MSFGRKRVEQDDVSTSLKIVGVEKKDSEDLGGGILKIDDSSFISYFNREETLYILGRRVGNNTFHIMRIANKKRKNGINGAPGLMKIFKKMESDLRKLGMKQLSTDCAIQLVPMAVKFLHFRALDIDQSRVSQIIESGGGKIPQQLTSNLLTILLFKDL